eukprot:GFUD01009052.1.p1 GENE.GFUD01009052.1~~GFUD01009052.1.p1  ORF type:complete len:184 (+),score=53.51 GFUD01009052.1:95-646(+)
MKIVFFCIAIIFSLLPDMYDAAIRGGGGGNYGSRWDSRWRRRPWEVGYWGNRNNPRRPWDRVWQNRRQQEEDKFIVKTERPRYYENEETVCTGLCLIKKFESLNEKSEKKGKKRGGAFEKSEITNKPKKLEALNDESVKEKKKRVEKGKKRGGAVKQSGTTNKPQKDKAPCLGMCALMKQRTG